MSDDYAVLCISRVLDECNARISGCLPCDEYNVRIYFYLLI